MSAQVINPRYEILDAAPGPETPPYTLAKARDREEGRVVALQMVSLSVLGPDPRLRQQFQAAVHEAQTLEHPGILRVFDEGVAESTGDLYIVREQIRGITLQERIRRVAPFTLAVATDIALSVAEALMAAHRIEIVHGDLRPCHILLSPEGQIKVADFVYGRIVAVQREDPARAAYLAPELAVTGEPTFAGDIYALGAMLYEMLTGVPPMAGTARVTSPRDINPGVPPALDGLVRKALQADPAARYQSISLLLADLQAIRDALRTGKSLAWSPQAEKISEKPAEGAGETKAEKRAPRPSATDATLIVPREEALSPSAGAITAAAHDLDEERYGMREREPSSALGRLTAAMIILTILCIIGLSWYLVKDFAEVPNDIHVPNLIGKTFDDAKRIAEQQHFTLVESPNSDYSDTMPENQVYEQNPLPGHTIKAEKEVTVYRSLGPRLLTIPSLIGTTQESASHLLQQANLPLGNISQEYSEKIPSGVVMRQSPNADSRVARNTAVNFVVSKGKQPPDAPTDVAGSAVGPEKVNLSWHGMPRAESYTILRSLDGDTTTIARGLPDTHFTDTNLKPNTTYSYTINAVNSSGASGPSESALVTTEASPAAPLVLPPSAVVTPPDTTPTPDASGATVFSSEIPDQPKNARLRQFTVEFRVPRRPRRTRHVQVDVQDVTGNNLVHDENYEPGEQISVPLQAFGNKVTFRILIDGKIVKQQIL